MKMLLKIEGYDDALLGIIDTKGEQVYVYDYDLLKQMVMQRKNMSKENARLYLERNVLDVFVGDGGPRFMIKK
jgi:hypothetical protein